MQKNKTNSDRDRAGHGNLEERLKEIEWMLSKKARSLSGEKASGPEKHDQGYGDLTELNRNGAILQSVGKELLGDIVSEYLDLLGTSSAVYEKNGDYAYGIFSSGWCRLLDRSSRKLCDTEENAAALNSGKWLCHESCWTRCSKKAIAAGAPVDIRCHGGLRLYAVPVFAAGDVIGAVNFGYGKPPEDPEKLRKLADTYHTDYEGLLQEARDFNARPEFIVELAKERLHSSARLIGALVERKCAEDALAEREFFIEKVMDHLPIGVAVNSVDPSTSFSYMNDRFAKIYRTTKEALSKPDAFWKTVYEDPAFRKEIKKRVLEDCASGDPERMYWSDVPFTRKGEGPFFISAHNIPLKGSELMVSTVWDTTDRRRAEDALRESEERLLATLLSIGDAVISTDEQGRVVTMNPIAENLCGWELAAARDKPLTEIFRIVNAKTRKTAEDPVKKALKSGRIVGLANHTLLLSRNGTEYQIADSCSPIKSAAGRIIGAVLVFRDVTETYQAREQLKHERDLSRSYLDTTQTVMTALDAEGRITMLNRAGCELLGYSREEILGRKWFETCLPQPEGMDRIYPVFRQIMAGDLTSADYIENTVLCKDGSQRLIGWHNSCLKDTDGRIIGALSSGIDITERKRREAYHEMGREVLETLNEPGDFHDLMQCVLSVLKMRTGFDAVGIRLKEANDFPYYVQDGFSPDFLSTENTLIERDASGGVCRDENGNISLGCTCGLVLSGKTDPDHPLFTRGGSAWTNDSLPILDLPPEQDPRLHPRNNCIHQGYASVALIPVRAKREIVGLIQFNDRRKNCFTPETIAILEGVAEHIGSALMRRRTEEEKRKLQEQLTRAEKLNAVGQLAGGVAHDYNNMLQVILGHAEIAMKKMDSSNPLYTHLEEIFKAGKRSSEVTRQLLTYAQKQTVSPAQIDLNATLESMLKMLRFVIGENIKLIWLPGADVWPVKMDPSQMDQILLNLCVNARDAIDGTGTVTIETSNITADETLCARDPDWVPGEYAVIRISDTGCGMNKEILSRLFEPFFTTKEVGEGVGLGLATVYGIIKQNKGSISVYSEPGQGAAYNIYLPRNRSGSEMTPKKEETKMPDGHGETILLAEDQTAILELGRALLEKLGYTVLTAGSPKEALRLAETHEGKIDLLLTDVIMPDMNGRDLAERIRQIRPGIRILYISGYTSDIITGCSAEKASVCFLQKPFTADELSNKVRQALEQ